MNMNGELDDGGFCTYARDHGQRGVALVMAMVILLVLTILGVTIMNVSGLEARMAGNTQESVRAFQFAESAIAQTVVNPSLSYNLTDTNPCTNGPSSSYATTTVCLIGKSAPPGRSADPSQINSAVNLGKAHFQVTSRVQTAVGGKTEVVQGLSKDIHSSAN